MSNTLYFSKINISSHIFDIYKDPSKIKEINRDLYLDIDDGIKHIYEYTNIDEEGNEINNRYTYEFYNIQKIPGDLDRTIVGSVLKTMIVFTNELNEATGRLIPKANPHKEVIQFFYYIDKEIVTYHTSSRFGFKEFNKVFEELINKAMNLNENEEYYFNVNIRRKGLELEQIKKELKNIGELETLKIETVPPNPDDDLLNEIHKNGEDYLHYLEEGNVTQRKVEFTSKAPTGLNMDGEIINEELNQIENVHSELSSKEATKNGYVRVNASSKNGRKYSSNDNQPVKDTINKNNMSIEDFARACKRKIQILLGTNDRG